jgi:predicted O-methyltransferase YrrM
MRFDRSSIPEIGRLLSVLVASRPQGRFAEIGTGCGVASAWMAETMGPEATLVSVELDAERAAAAGRLFAERPSVRVLHGDWHEELPPEAPFDLLFFDGGAWKRLPAEEVDEQSRAALDLVSPGGMVVIDDLTPEALQPEEWRGQPDPARDFWLGEPGLTGIEILTTPQSAAIVATKR